MANENFTIKFEDRALLVKEQRSQISAVPKEYNSTIAKMNQFVEVLDRYDDFSALKIDPAQYEICEGSEYGITRGRTQTEAIYPHQQKAALAFLKELRGFGLLADVVGSGKTFEAGVVLSELAVRGNVKSMLIIVPKQVFGAWQDVMEMKFGMGKGVLKEVDATPDVANLVEKCADGFLRPKYPLLVRMEDFVQWDKSLCNILFDVVVVDEAHHLCEEEGANAEAMRLLSLMMETKKKADKTYCVLLSATPHSGNLENMFRLWYFIRCNGGNNADFVLNGGENHSKQYNEEKKYYKEHICRGATTVMEFIKKVKISEVEEKYRKQLNAYLGKDVGSYASKTEGERWAIVDDFLNREENRKISDDVSSSVASAYHNGILRSIMIRQPNHGLSKKKTLVNYLFYPATNDGSTVKMKGVNGEDITVNVEGFNGNDAITTDGLKMSLDAYIREKWRNGDDFYVRRQKKAEFIMDKFLPQMGMTDTAFPKVNSKIYYEGRLRSMPKDVDNEFYPIHVSKGESAYSRKVEKLKEILRTHHDSRVLIFFDYDKKRAQDFIDKVEQELRQEKDLKDRLMIGSADKRDAIASEFEKPENSKAILFVKDAAFTEGINLQSSNIIVNFQVTPDPLAMDQRIGRVFRLGQTHDVLIYSLAEMCDLEGYVLLYFSSIGLMTSNGGDATILAGSNNERMITVRCHICGNVKLYSQEDYEIMKRNNSHNLYCEETERCREENPNGTLMDEISVYDFKCDDERCGCSFTRSVSDEGYFCMSISNEGSGIMTDGTRRNSMCNSGNRADRSFYCRKICSIAHCSMFTSGKMKGKCPALKAYKEDGNISDADLMCYCETCENKKECQRMGCCVGIDSSSISSCMDCDKATCRPKPHKIVFNEKWEAACPICQQERRKGKIRPIQARTFATYIRGAWAYEYDKGKAFCENLGKEALKVAEIKEILEKDGMKE